MCTLVRMKSLHDKQKKNSHKNEEKALLNFYQWRGNGKRGCFSLWAACVYSLLQIHKKNFWLFFILVKQYRIQFIPCCFSRKMCIFYFFLFFSFSIISFNFPSFFFFVSFTDMLCTNAEERASTSNSRCQDHWCYSKVKLKNFRFLLIIIQ